MAYLRAVITSSKPNIQEEIIVNTSGSETLHSSIKCLQSKVNNILTQLVGDSGGEEVNDLNEIEESEDDEEENYIMNSNEKMQASQALKPNKKIKQ